jgi:hypothetical protein
MNEDFINEQFDNLKKGNLTQYFISQSDFLIVRKVLVTREDFKHFRGIAQRGGAVLYQYMDVPRS